MGKSVNIDPITQNLKEQLNAGLDLDPKEARRFGLSNMAQRVIGYLMGWNYINGKPVKLACNPDGSLRASVSASGYSVNETLTDNAPDAYGASIPFTKSATKIDIMIFDNDADIMLSADGVTYNDPILIPANSLFHVEATVASFKVKNHVGGSVAVFQMIGWW